MSEVKVLEKIPKSTLICGKAIGQGGFGNVVKGTHNGKDVVVKILHSPVRAETYIEFTLMFQLSHRNLTRFVGLVDLGYNECPQLVYWHACKGNLLQYVESMPDDVLEPLRLGMLNKLALDVVHAMEYLHERHYLHKTLAARNVLLHQSGDYVNAQVSDYGISRVIDGQGSNYYKTEEGLTLPIRWVPKECIPSGQSSPGGFSFASDVWSFGVVLWEAWTKGETPYGASRSNTEVRQLLLKGSSPLTFIRPKCPDQIMGIMDNIFREKPEDRPTFTQLGKSLGLMKPSGNPNKNKEKNPSGEQKGNNNEQTKDDSSKNKNKQRSKNPSQPNESNEGVKNQGRGPRPDGRPKGPRNPNAPPGQHHSEKREQNRREGQPHGRSHSQGRRRQQGQPNPGGPPMPFDAPPPYTPLFQSPPPLLGFAGAFTAPPPSLLGLPGAVPSPPPPYPSAGAEDDMAKKMKELQEQIKNLEVQQQVQSLEQKLQNLQKEVQGSRPQNKPPKSQNPHRSHKPNPYNQPNNPNQGHQGKHPNQGKNPNQEKFVFVNQQQMKQNPQNQNKPHHHRQNQQQGNNSAPDFMSNMPDWLPVAGAAVLGVGAAMAAAAMSNNDDKKGGSGKKKK